MLQQHTNQQLLDFLKQSIRLGENIMKSDAERHILFAEYNERMAELVEYLNENRSGMNLLISWKVDSFEVYSPQKNYSPDWNKLLRLLRMANKEAEDENIVAYIKKQNMLMGAIEFYYRHQ